jgi:hypothetical protein
MPLSRAFRQYFPAGTRKTALARNIYCKHGLFYPPLQFVALTFTFRKKLLINNCIEVLLYIKQNDIIPVVLKSAVLKKL